MKNLNILLATFNLLLLGCADLSRQQQEHQPILKSEGEREASVPVQSKAIPCDFTTTVATTKFPIAISSGGNSLKLESTTAMSGHSSFISSKTLTNSKSKRQKEICDQIENEFVGFNNPWYRRQHYVEEFSIPRIREITKNLRSDEYVETKADKKYFAVEYSDPKGDTREPIKIKSISIDSQCKTGTKVNADEYSRYYQFRHSNQCEFTAVDQEYTLNSGEKIRISLSGNLSADKNEDDRLQIFIKEVSWRDVN